MSDFLKLGFIKGFFEWVLLKKYPLGFIGWVGTHANPDFSPKREEMFREGRGIKKV